MATATVNEPTSRNVATNGVDILPIPPALEFPYPLQETGVTNNGNDELAKQDPTTQTIPNSRSNDETVRQQRIRRHTMERPGTMRRPTFTSRTRRQTQRQDLYTPGIWDSSSDDSSSSEEEPESSQKLTKSNSLREKLSHIRTGRTGQLAGRTRGSSMESSYSKFALGNSDYKTKGHVSRKDGRLKISLKEIGKQGYLAKALDATFKRPAHDSNGKAEASPTQAGNTHDRRLSGTTANSSHQRNSTERSRQLPVPSLNIVIMVIGSRGDIQPFLRLGKILQDDYGHRIRIATHPTFKEFIEKDSKLEFFSVGGDPAELMAFMVKNPGLIPKTKTIRSGEIIRRREAMYEMFKGFWRACINDTDDEMDMGNLKMMEGRRPFVADAIIANPPSFAHIHCAERLGIPLHLMFTFPVSPTQQFPHPLANIKQSNVEANYTNFMSYPLVEMVQWQGLGDLINRFRVKSLGLEAISTLWAPGQLFRLKVPTTYLWSPSLIPKPADWGSEINVAGFVFLDLASSFKPPDELAKFLDAGDPPVYIGFGSIVVDDPDRVTNLIFEAVKTSGARALVSKGWGGLGGDNVPDNIFMLDNTPHDWLFPRVSAVVHHGGAGTTAIGLKCGKPTMIVPFFGDQPFWGAMVAKAGAGAEPIPYKKLTAERLADAIKILLLLETQEAAKKLASNIEEEGDGAKNAIKYFLDALPMSGNHCMRCSIFQDRVAVWWLKNTHMRLSALAAELLIRQRKIKWSDLRLIRHYDWNDFEGPGEPFTGAGLAVAGTLTTVVRGIGKVPFDWAKTIRHGHRGDRRASTQVSGGGGERTTHTLTNHNTNHPSISGVLEDNVAVELTKDTQHGLKKSGKALAKAPMDISLALARGFHNAPRLYGDDTVRTPRRVTGIRSGLRTAGEEFRHGVYDGWTGVIRQPYHGVREEGAWGLIKGTGRGIGGFVLKDIAAVWSLPAYTMKGIHEELIKSRQPTKFIRRSRVLAGQKDLISLDQHSLQITEEKVQEAWEVILALQREIQIARSKGLRGRIAIHHGKRMWKRYGIFESIEQAKKALASYQAGRSLEMDFGKLPAKQAGHNAPRDHLIDGKEEKLKKKAAYNVEKERKARNSIEGNDRVVEAG